MRPRRLSIDNFTCYSDLVEIDFDGMDVFVISGPTGAGKTTVIDAICYALYGRVPRDPSKKNSSLIAHGRDRMRVELEFQAASLVYRISRGINLKRRTSKTGAEQVGRDLSPVQFERLTDAGWEPVADRVETIDREIERVVGLDFDGFTRCVLLPQGRFAEFLSGEPRERRKIFMELLELHVYERIMQLANRRHEDLRRDAQSIDTRLREDFADATEEALAQRRSMLAEAVPVRDAAIAQRNALQQACRHADGVKSARARERERREQADQKTDEVEAEERLAQDGQHQLEALAAGIATLEAQLQAKPYDPKLHRTLSVALERARAVDQLRVVTEAARAAAGNASAVETAQDTATQSRSRCDSASHALRDAEVTLDAARRADAAAHVRTGLKAGDSCPVCGGTVVKLAKAERSDLRGAERGLAAAKKDEQAARDALVKSGQALARAQAQHENAKRDAHERAQQLSAAEHDLRTSLPKGMVADTTDIAAAVSMHEQAAVEREKLTGDLERVRRERSDLESRMAQSSRSIAALREAAAGLMREAEAAAAEGDDHIRVLVELASAHDWHDALASIEARKYPGPFLESRLSEARTETDDLTAAIERLRGETERIERDIARAKELRQRLGALKEEAERYRELGTLLRGDNFLDYVIEEAMRVLADSATEHLRRLYGRFSITVKGIDFLVVDHWQADNQRSAKTLSGGETFVASLALALALSDRLPELQSRAAATLESLFLDEGFGTIDRETLDPVIDTLEGLRAEGRMVGIITHVPELAQRIEQRIEVQKSPSGSSVHVVRS